MVNVERLEKLANHLLSGKLGHETFNFGVYNVGGRANLNECGTQGCAIGECPVIWPNDWAYVDSLPTLRILGSDPHEGSITTSIAGRAFFHLTAGEYEYLFIPGNETNNRRNALSQYASKEDVANRILRFCEIVKEESL